MQGEQISPPSTKGLQRLCVLKCSASDYSARSSVRHLGCLGTNPRALGAEALGLYTARGGLARNLAAPGCTQATPSPPSQPGRAGLRVVGVVWQIVSP